jgi:CheY-like chemotaxis protein
MPISDLPADATAAGIRVLFADDDKGVRTLFATLLRATAGVGSVIEAKDGAEAVELASEQRLDVALLDLNMPRLDGVETAIRLGALQPSLQIALHSSDPELLRKRADGLELPLFDKVDFDRLLEWVERHARDTRAAGERDVRLAPMARKVDLCCSRCSYGIVSRTPPARCPMCGGDASWTEPRGWSSRQAPLPETARRLNPGSDELDDLGKALGTAGARLSS